MFRRIVSCSLSNTSARSGGRQLWKHFPLHIHTRTVADCTSYNALSEKKSITPMMKQYFEVKKAHSEYMVLFQVGDFYEIFFEDAIRASDLLGITLTKRKTSAFQIPMCGVPCHAVQTYLQRLVMQHGVFIAICDQVESIESARRRSESSLVKREVVRLVTPGTLTEDSLLTPESNNFLASLFVHLSPLEPLRIAMTWADLSTGKFHTTSTSSFESLKGELIRCSPREVILPEYETISEEKGGNEVIEKYKILVEHCIPPSCIQTRRPLHTFEQQDPKFFRETYLSEKDPFHSSEIYAASAVINYLQYTQKSTESILQPLEKLEEQRHMIIDPNAWKALEISETFSGTRRGSLLDCIDRTKTAAGSRLLANHLTAPLHDVESIEDRFNAIDFFLDNPSLVKALTGSLASCSDVERSLQRIVVGRGSAKDLKEIGDTVLEMASLFDRIRKFPALLPELLDRSSFDMDEYCSIRHLAVKIRNAMKDELSALVSKGGFIKPGYSKELDEWRDVLSLRGDGSEDDEITGVERELRGKEALQTKYRALTGIKALRVQERNKLGLVLEVPRKAEHMVPQGHDFRLVHSTKNVLRYKVQELMELDVKMYEAYAKIARIEHAIFHSLRKDLLSCAQEITHMTEAVALLDVLLSHSVVAAERGFIRPVVDGSFDLHVIHGRHPVVEHAQMNREDKPHLFVRTFVPNDIHLSGDLLENHGLAWLVTGPNMGGKSTFLRQNALLVLMAQIGCYIPATFARLGLVDKIFCRVGSSDDVASDRSTFMVEMQETATILHQATPRSLVLMDEVGRGTSVNEGLSIACAILEDLCARNTRTIFATHFHNLGEMTSTQAMLKAYCMEVYAEEKKGSEIGSETAKSAQSTNRSDPSPVFSHRVIPGTATHSHAMDVALLAGCPKSTIERAKRILQGLTEGLSIRNVGEVLPPNSQAGVSKLAERLRATDIDNLSPREALEVLYELKSLL